MARLLRVLVVSLLSVFVSLLLLSNAQAQVSSVNNTTSTPIEGAGHDYVKLLSETVNPANGAVSIRIELPTPKSRGITLPFSIAYDSNGVLHLEPSQIIPQGYGTANWATDIGFLSQGGWSYSVPLLNYNTWGVDHPYIIGYDSGGGPNWGHHNCYYASGYLFKDAAGSRHSLHLGALSIAAVDYPDATSECADLRRSGGGDADVWGALAPYPGESGYYGELPVTVSDKNGMSYTFPAGNQFTVPGTKPLTNFVLPSKIEDGNGNIVNVTRNGSTTSYAMTDTAGRSVLLVNGFGTSGTTVTADGATYQVTWKTVTFGSYSVNPIWKGQGSGPSGGDYCAPIPSVNGGSEVVISQVTLPNGQSYKFYYGSDNPDVSFRNPYGMLSEIDYPSGGSVKYKWALTGTRGELGVYPAAYSAGGDVTPDANYCIYQYQTPAVSERDVFYGGSTTPALTQSFSYSTTWSSSPNPNPGDTWTQKTTTTTIADNTTGKSTFTTQTYSPILNDPEPFTYVSFPTQTPVEDTTITYDWNSSTPLRTVVKTWYDQYLLASEQTTLENGQSSTVTYCYTTTAPCSTPPYNSAFPALKEKKEYDFSGSVARRTVNNYIPVYYPVFSNKPCQTLVYDGSNNLLAETDSFYDNAANPCVAGAPSVSDVSGLPANTHDETLYGSGGSTSRGNLTKLVKKCFPGCSDQTTTYTYDKTGQVLSTTDARGNTAQYSYANSFTVLSGAQNVSYTPSSNLNAYLTRVTYPQTGSTTHIENFTYDYNNGQLTVSQDQNGNNTSYLYNDVFFRPRQVSYPDGGQVNIDYNDTPLAVSVTKTTAIQGGASPINKIEKTIFDGIGHAVQTQLVSDPEGVTYVDTTYNGMGNALAVSNPYRDASHTVYLEGLSYGTTQYSYDILGRTLTTTLQDGSTTIASYNGSTTTATDEAGKQRKTYTDALGRLTTVWEDPSNLNYVTNYFYDGLDHMTCVEQHGDASGTGCSSNPSGDATSAWRVRRFSYNSLSQLTSATNPESGTLSYSYDVNGNVVTKSAPAPNQTGSATVTTTYSYDALNRLTQKSYSDGTTATAKYGYDGVAPSGCTPPTVVSQPSWGVLSTPSNLIGRRSSMCDASGGAAWVYDLMGRPKLEQRLLGTANKTIGYTYYLSGGPSRIWYPSGTGAYQWITAAGRSNGVGDSYNNYVFSNVAYYPNGAVREMGMGPSSAFAGIMIERAYNKRLQPMLEYALVAAAGPPYQNLYQRCYDFHMKGGVSGSIGGVICSFPDAAPGDNGNLYQVQNQLDSNRTQNFTYDALNRVTSAYSNGPNWGQSFTTDPWSNLTNVGSITGKNNPGAVNVAPATVKNRLPGFTYDAAGNPIAGPGSTVTFDAENRVICLGSCTAPGGWTYTYDGDGKRVKKSNGSTGTLYWTGMGSDALDESDLSGNINEEYFYFNGQRAARVDRPSNVVHYYVNDRLGTASIEATPVTHDTVTFSDSDYSPYGIQIPVAGSDSNHYKFMGKERDTETGLDNFGARYYASVLGRFMTPDWAARPTAVPYAVFGDPQSLNLYVFVRDNPVNHVDADGHECNKNNYTHQCNEHAEVQKQSLWARTVSAFTFSKSRTKEVNVVNENAVDNKTGLTANTKVVGASITGSISSNPANNKFNLSGGAEFHGLKSTMNFSSDPNGSNGMVNGIVKIDSFTAAASGSGGSDGGSMKGEAQVFTASGTTKAGSLTITGSFCLICAGGQLKATSTGAAVGVNYLIGADVSVDWGSSTILHASDTAK